MKNTKLLALYIFETEKQAIQVMLHNSSCNEDKDLVRSAITNNKSCRMRKMT